MWLALLCALWPFVSAPAQPAPAQPAPAQPAPAQPAPAQSGELPRGGAARPLRLVTASGAPLSGSARDVAWEAGGAGVFFTLEAGGTRNIWRAFPDPQDGARYPAWRALPVTKLRAPRYAAQPVPLPGERALVCVSNALTRASDGAQIVRYDLVKARWQALSDDARLYSDPAVSPDGARAAIDGEGNAQTGVFLAPTRPAKRRGLPDVGPLVTGARHPVWLDDQTLLIEGAAPNALGLYALASDKGASRRLVVAGGGEAQALGAKGIVFAAKTALDGPPRLFLIARDGSGLRALAQTAGACRPAPDGRSLAFDAPANNDKGAPRILWILPLQSPASSAETVATTATAGAAPFRLIADRDGAPASEPATPVAQLGEVRVAAGRGLAIVGDLSGPGDALVALEVGEGDQPRKWEQLALLASLQTPILANGQRVLAFWNPPKARGTWTLRLSLARMGGAAQSVLRVRLPLPANAPALPDAPLPQVPSPAIASANQNVRPGAASEIGEAAANWNGSTLLKPDEDQPLLPIFPAPVPPLGSTAGERENSPNLAPAPIPALQSAPVSAPQPEAASPESSDQAPQSADAPTRALARFAAEFDVEGAPARVAPGEKLALSFSGQNMGSAAWQTGARGAGRVRLVARWIDFSTGTRRGWNYFWLPEPVASAGRTRRALQLTAPTRPGQYKLIFGLVQLPASGEFKAPAWNAPQEGWKDEFAAIAFAVEVAAPNADGGAN